MNKYLNFLWSVILTIIALSMVIGFLTMCYYIIKACA